MTTELPDRLYADMERFTGDLRVPDGLALKAYRHHRQRRRTLRVTAASVAAIAVAASAVAIAGVSGAFGSARAPVAQVQTMTTAYVLKHVESALAPASIDNLISLDRIAFPPGTTLEPVVGGGTTAGGGTSPWDVASMLHWEYQGSLRYSAYGPSGQHVFDLGFSIADGSATQTTVLYGSRTWWTATLTAPGARRSSGCASGTSIHLPNGLASSWTAYIESQLSCGAFTVVGHQVVDGVDGVEITGDQSHLTLLVNPATYLPIQLSIGQLSIGFQWLSPTPANLAQLKVSVPAGFQQVPPAQG